MPNKYSPLLLVAVLATAACSGAQVQIDHVEGANPASFRSFAMIPLPDEYRPQPLNEIEERGEAILRARLAAQLTDRGYKRVTSVEDNPDVLATVFVSYRPHKERRSGARSGAFDYPDTWRTYAKGTVVFLLADPTSHQVVWQAKINGERYIGQATDDEVSVTEADLQTSADNIMNEMLNALREDQISRGIDPNSGPEHADDPAEPADDPAAAPAGDPAEPTSDPAEPTGDPAADGPVATDPAAEPATE